MAKCWCGQIHGKGDVRNGEMRHWVSNWQLYFLRKDSQEKEAKKKG